MTPEQLAARGLRVKPLEWEVFDHQTAWAKSVLGVYRYDAGALTLSTQKNYIGDGAGNWHMATIEAAKAAAEADHVARVAAMIEEIE